MPNFHYKARDQQGRQVLGLLEAASENELMHKLHQLNLMPVKVQENLAELQEKIQDQPQGLFAKRIKTQDIVFFNMQLASMIDAGLTLLSALNVLARQSTNPALKNTIQSMADFIAEGGTFSDALLVHRGIFSNLYISLVRAGEAGGNLNVVLNRLAVYMEEQEDLKNKIKGVLIYPAILMVAGLLVIMLIVTFVLPKFMAVFEWADVALPVVTQILYGFGLTVKSYWYIIIIGMAGVVYGIKMYVRTPIGRWQKDKLMLCLPWLGSVLRQAIVARFSRTLATLLESGVPMLQALDILKEVVGNDVYAKVIADARQAVERGERLDYPLKLSKEFPDDAVHMISVGEEAGKLPLMLNKIAAFYEMTVSYSVKRLTALIEPAFIVVMGAVVGFIMAAMLIPIFDMTKTIQR